MDRELREAYADAERRVLGYAFDLGAEGDSADTQADAAERAASITVDIRETLPRGYQLPMSFRELREARKRGLPTTVEELRERRAKEVGRQKTLPQRLDEVDAHYGLAPRQPDALDAALNDIDRRFHLKR